MTRHQRFLNRAVGVALTSEYKFKHGAVIVKGSRILAWSVNSFRNHSQIDYENSTLHAEEGAIRELHRSTGTTYRSPMDFRNYSIYVARVSRQGEPRMSRPCKSCWDLLDYYGFQTVAYTNEFGRLSIETRG